MDGDSSFWTLLSSSSGGGGPGGGVVLAGVVLVEVPHLTHSIGGGLGGGSPGPPGGGPLGPSLGGVKNPCLSLSLSWFHLKGMAQRERNQVMEDSPLLFISDKLFGQCLPPAFTSQLPASFLPLFLQYSCLPTY